MRTTEEIHLEMVVTLMSPTLEGLCEIKRRRFPSRSDLVKWRYLLRDLTGHSRLSESSESDKMALMGGMMIEGEGWLGCWFFAINSGKKCKVYEFEFISSLISKSKPLKACTSLHRLPAASEIKKTVFRVKDARSNFSKGSKGGSRREARTRNKSQAGTLQGAVGFLRVKARITSRRTGSSE